MDLADAICEAAVRVVEVELTKEREKTRLMEEWLRDDQAALAAKERERSMLLREKDRSLAVKEAEEKLLADFLEADGNDKSFDGKAMIDAIVALRGPGGGDGNSGGGFGCVYGVGIKYLENTLNLVDEGAAMATVEGTNGDME